LAAREAGIFKKTKCLCGRRGKPAVEIKTGFRRRKGNPAMEKGVYRRAASESF